jgi:predicted HTH domain antitoxin
MIEVTIKLPDDFARTLGDTPETVAQHLLQDAAIEGYRSRRLSHRDVAEALGMDYWQAERFLADHGVPLNYSIAELEADAAALGKILRDK